MDVTIAPLDAVPHGEGRTFSMGGERVAVFRMRDGGVYAVQADCPHRGGPLADGLTGGMTLVCPLHAWKFDLSTGAALDRSCTLKTFPVRVDEAGHIVLTMEESRLPSI
jgi:nitrite reductase (NADH) small subunit